MFIRCGQTAVAGDRGRMWLPTSVGSGNQIRMTPLHKRDQYTNRLIPIASGDYLSAGASPNWLRSGYSGRFGALYPPLSNSFSI